MRSVTAIDLFAPRPSSLAGRLFPAWLARVLNQVVGTIQIGGVAGSIHARADTEAVDRHALPQQPVYRVFVEVAASENADIQEYFRRWA